MNEVLAKRSVFVLAVVLATVAGCRTKPNSESCLNSPCITGVCDHVTQRCSVPDGGIGTGNAGAGGGRADARIDGGSGALDGSATDGASPDTSPMVGTVLITSPSGPIYTNKAISIQVSLSEGAAVPAQIDLLKNGAALATIFPPAPFAFTWDTTVEIEGTYVVTARAILAGQVKISDPVTVHVDRTPPSLVTQLPIPGAADVDVHAPIQLGFSEAILPASVTASTLVVAGGGMTISGPATLGADGRTIATSVVDGFSLTLPTMLVATIAPTITDLAGNAFIPVGTWSWNAPAWMVTPPITTATDPVLRVDPRGRPLVLFSHATSIGPSVFLETLELAAYENGTWGSPFGSPATYPDAARLGYGLALDAAGNPTIAWSEPGADANYIRVASWTGSSWDTTYPQLDGTPGSTSATHPSVRMDKSGRPVVSWLENNGMGVPDVFVARWTGTAWDHSLGSVGLSFAYVGSGDMVLDAQDAPIVTWSIMAGSGVATWNGNWTISPVVSGVPAPTVALDGAQAPMTAARAPDLRVVHLMGGQWLNQETVVPASTSVQNPTVLRAADGNAAIAWVDTNSPASIGLAHWTGTSWDLRFGLFSAGAGVAPLGQTPELAIDANGRFWVAWQEGGSIYVWKSNY